MLDSAHIDSLITDVGPRDPDIMEALRLKDDLWVVRFEGVDIEIEHDADTDRLVLSASIAPVAAERRAQVYEDLLAYNMRWRETGGVRMALGEPEGPVRQFLGLHAGDLDADRLSIVLHNLKERTFAWRTLFEGEKPIDPIPPSHPMLAV